MTDINELRRLAQAATHPTTKGRWMRLFGERMVYDRMEDGCRGIPIVATDHPPAKQEAAYLDFIAAANPATISDLLDRLEAAEKEREELRAVARHESDCVDACMQEIDALKEEAARLRGGLALIADQYEPKCSLLIPSIARSALCATGAYGQNEKGIKFCLACGNSLQSSPDAKP